MKAGNNCDKRYIFTFFQSKSVGLGRRFRIHRSHRCRNQKEILGLIMRYRLLNRNHYIPSWPNNYEPIISYRQKTCWNNRWSCSCDRVNLATIYNNIFLSATPVKFESRSHSFIHRIFFLRRPGWCSGVCLFDSLAMDKGSL